MMVLRLITRSKTTLLIILSAAILVSLSLYGSGIINAHYPLGNGAYVMRSLSGPTEMYLWCEFPTVQTELPELLVENLSITEDLALSIASRSPFNMGGPLTIAYGAVEGTTLIGVNQGTLKNATSVCLYTSGPIIFSTPAYSSSNLHFAPFLPSKDVAKQAADAFLLELQQSEAFYPKPPHTLTFKHVEAGSTVWVAGQSWVNYWSVVYAVEYDGMPVSGFSRVHVFVGSSGSIVGLFSECRNLVPSGDMVKITVTPQEAFEKMQSPYMTAPARVDIYSVELTYYAYCIIDEPGYLQPVYKFSGTMTGADGSQQAFASYVDATD
jgi:hypothetical protein